VSGVKAKPLDAPKQTYWVEPGRILAGRYPGARTEARTFDRLDDLMAVGVSWWIDLTCHGELEPYDALLPPTALVDAHRPVVYSRHPILDHGLPTDALQMNRILDEIDRALADGHCVYVHCHAGIGRTGLVIGCYLARRLADGERALAALTQLWRDSSRHREFPRTPETEEQADYIRQWCEVSAVLTHEAVSFPFEDITAHMRDRYQGLLYGLALGDALAAPAQARTAGTFMPIRDLLGGGPFDLPRGAWTDDTAMPLMLADSLLEHPGFDAEDYRRRLRDWQRLGTDSATGQCVGITAPTVSFLNQESAVDGSSSVERLRLNREPLLGMGVVAASHLVDPEAALLLAERLARLTHDAPMVVDASRYIAALVLGALQGASAAELLSPEFCPLPELWVRHPLTPAFLAVLAEDPQQARTASEWSALAGGTIVDTVRVLRWCLSQGRNFRDTVLCAVNLGHDADINSALVGQLAGAIYGFSSIPPHWSVALMQRDRISSVADRLLLAALTDVSAAPIVPMAADRPVASF
jgi:ADP-ribosylglycohydrolase